MSEQLKDAVGGMIYSGYRADVDPYELAGQIISVIAEQVRARCTPSADAYRAGGDHLIAGVAEWISSKEES